MFPSRCALQWQSFSERPAAAALFFRDTQASRDGIGVDLLPSKHKRLSEENPIASLQPATTDIQPQIGHCDGPEGKGLHLIHERIGPFESSGGYNWFQIYYQDALSLDSVFKKGEKLALYRGYLGHIHGNGDIIGYPPLAIHHGRVLPGWGQPVFKSYPYTASGCFLHGRCMDQTAILGGAGDLICLPDEGSYDCMIQTQNVTIESSLSLNLESNDVRPRGSPNLTFYWALSAVVGSSDYLTRLDRSTSLIINPNLGNTALVSGDSMHIMFATFPVAGRLDNLHPHHHAFFHSHVYRADVIESTAGYLRAVSGSAIISGTIGIVPYEKLSYRRSFSTTNAGYASNEQLLQFVRNHVRLKCIAETKFEDVAHITVPRTASVACKPWRFNRGDTMTIVSLLHSDGYMEVQNFHLQWFFDWYPENPGTQFRTFSLASIDTEYDCFMTPRGLLHWTERPVWSTVISLMLLENRLSALVLAASIAGCCGIIFFGHAHQPARVSGLFFLILLIASALQLSLAAVHAIHALNAPMPDIASMSLCTTEGRYRELRELLIVVIALVAGCHCCIRCFRKFSDCESSRTKPLL